MLGRGSVLHAQPAAGFQARQEPLEISAFALSFAEFADFLL